MAESDGDDWREKFEGPYAKDEDGSGGGGGGLSWAALKAILSNVGLRSFLLVFLGTGTVNLLVGGGDVEEGLLTSPRAFIEQVIVDWMYESFVKPIAASLWDAGVALLDSIAIVTFGGDYSLGHPGETTVGLLDLPFLVTVPLGGGFLSVGETINNAINAINQPLINALKDAGVVAPFVAPVLIMGEFAIVLWVAWIIVQSVDVPGIRLMSALKAIGRPVFSLVRWLLK